MIRLHPGRSCLAWLLVAIGLALPQSQPVSQEVPPPTIRVSTRLVLVDVVVTDKQGKPVPGLKAEDFTLEEKGKAQKIALFTPPQQAKQASPPELAPGVYTNRSDFRAPGGPITAVLLDAANTPFLDQAYARDQMLKYVAQQMKPGERMGIFALTTSLRVLQDFTSDPQVLLTALKNYKPSEQERTSAGPVPTSNMAGTSLRPGGDLLIGIAQEELRNFESAQIGYELDRRTEVTLDAMRSLGRILGGLPGRKSIVWLTAAFPFELVPENRTMTDEELMESLPNVKQKNVGTTSAGSLASTERQGHAQQIRDVAFELSSAQVAIYPVDVRGLISGMEGSAGHQAVAGSSPIANISDVTASQDTMREIASQTGGRAYVNQNEIRDGVAMVGADNAASYTLGYYPADKKWDGKYRSLKVKVNHEGIETRYRQGYFAVDLSQEKDRKPEEEAAAGLRDGAPNTQVTFSARYGLRAMASCRWTSWSTPTLFPAKTRQAARN